MITVDKIIEAVMGKKSQDAKEREEKVPMVGFVRRFISCALSSSFAE